MNLTSLLIDGDNLVPIELVWATLDPNNKRRALRMLEQGDLLCQGRNLLMDNTPFQSGLGKFSDIPVETWRDADKNLWDTATKNDKQFRLSGIHPDDVIVDIEIFNTERLRELVRFEKPGILTDDYDDLFFKSTQTKMGAKVWAYAAAALASGDVEPTSGKLAAFLLRQSEIWPKGQLSDRQLMKHLSPLVSEFKSRTAID